MPLPNGYMSSDEMIAAIDAHLDAIIADHTNKLVNAIETCEIRIIQMIRSGEYTSAGFMRLQTIHQDAVKILNDVYGRAVASLDYAGVVELVKEALTHLNIDVSYILVDKQMVEALKGNLADVYIKLGDSIGNRIGQVIYATILGGIGKDEVEAQIASILTGLYNRAGKPMTMYVGMYTQDGIMEFYSTLHRKKAKDAGIKRYLYCGTIAKNTRPFCRERCGKEYTEEQIQSWQNMQWKGKKEGNIWMTRGGYRCRHHFRPIVEPEKNENNPFS